MDVDEDIDLGIDRYVNTYTHRLIDTDGKIKIDKSKDRYIARKAWLHASFPCVPGARSLLAT